MVFFFYRHVLIGFCLHINLFVCDCVHVSVYVLVIKWEIWDENRFFSRPSFCLIGNEFSILCLLSGYTSLFQFETRKWEAKKNMDNYWTLGFDFRDRGTGLCERKLIVFLFVELKLVKFLNLHHFAEAKQLSVIECETETKGWLNLLLFKLKTCN